MTSPEQPHPALRLRPLGKSSLQVTQLGVGTAPLGDLYERLDEDQASSMLDTGTALGINLFDTSPLYGSGLAEHRTGRAMRRVPRDSVVVSTKVGRWYRPAGQEPADLGNWAGGLQFNQQLDYSYEGAMRSFEQSLLRLGLGRVDALLIHDVDVFTHGSREACDRRFDEAMNGAYRALEELRRCGDISAIGVGVNEADMCARFARAGDFDTMLLAGRYSLLEQPALDDFFPLAVEKRIGVMAGGVFNSGILASSGGAGAGTGSAKYNYSDAPPEIVDKVKRLSAVCERHDVPLAAAAIQFPLGHPCVSSVVIGSVSPAEVKSNFELMGLPIPDALWAELKHEGLLRPDAPTPARGT